LKQFYLYDNNFQNKGRTHTPEMVHKDFSSSS